MALAVRAEAQTAFLLKAITIISLPFPLLEKGNRITTCNPMTLSTVGDVPRNGLRVSCLKLRSHPQALPLARELTSMILNHRLVRLMMVKGLVVAISGIKLKFIPRKQQGHINMVSLFQARSAVVSLTIICLRISLSTDG